MLSKTEVEQAIRRGEIRLTYTSGLENISETEYMTNGVDPGQVDSLAGKAFGQNFSGNRLSLTLGPLVYSHNYKRKWGRKKYKDTPRVFDLRSSKNTVIVQPGESMTVNTAEEVEFDKHIGGLTFPRLTHATAGLVLSASYIDPLWSGLLVLELANLSDSPIELRIGEKIGALHFYRVDNTSLSQNDKDVFQSKSHHFGLTWQGILRDGREPFPFKKRPSPANTLRQVRTWATAHLPTIITGGFVLALFTGTFWLGQTSQDVAEALRASETVPSLEARVEKVEKSQPLAGTITVVIPAGQTTATANQELETGNRKSTILTSLNQGYADVEARANVSSGTEPSRTKISVQLTVPEASLLDRPVPVNFVITGDN
ncbi:hypothetical protein [Frigoribacterium sp. RIT-PI-h]|uniref:dCTP deaminase domain-containing protein n=1 Tax=Frigoribacterium sp. RIT-PI-h TaxID=1690245 RepID=UPI0009EC65D6|nr:hypothetical protein [Frigoribacterium sp. RIT-PI-h]